MRGMKITTGNEIIELKNFSVLSGGHCESSAMMNALYYHGVMMSENMINGFAASMSFGVASDEKFPMILMRVGEMKERFLETSGFKINEFHPENPQAAYDEVKQLLAKGIAVVLRVNLRYMTYLFGGKYGSKYTSFGWHFVTLVKIDELQGCAWVTDTAKTSLQKVKIADLAKARDSKEGMFKSDNVYYYFDNPDKSVIDYKAAFKKSLMYLIGNYEGEEGIISQLEKFPGFIENIEVGRNVFMLSSLFFIWYGYIEEFGTGGSGFRNFTHGYLLEMREKLKYNDMDRLVECFETVCTLWKELALKFKELSTKVKRIRNADLRAKEYKEVSETVIRVLKAEKSAYAALKEFYGKLE